VTIQAPTGVIDSDLRASDREHAKSEKVVDIYFSAEIETNDPIPGAYPMLVFRAG